MGAKSATLRLVSLLCAAEAVLVKLDHLLFTGFIMITPPSQERPCPSIMPNPTVVVLDKIARALEVPAAALVEGLGAGI